MPKSQYELDLQITQDGQTYNIKGQVNLDRSEDVLNPKAKFTGVTINGRDAHATGTVRDTGQIRVCDGLILDVVNTPPDAPTKKKPEYVITNGNYIDGHDVYFQGEPSKEFLHEFYTLIKNISYSMKHPLCMSFSELVEKNQPDEITIFINYKIPEYNWDAYRQMKRLFTQAKNEGIKLTTVVPEQISGIGSLLAIQGTPGRRQIHEGAQLNISVYPVDKKSSQTKRDSQANIKRIQNTCTEYTSIPIKKFLQPHPVKVKNLTIPAAQAGVEFGVYDTVIKSGRFDPKHK